MVEKMTYTYDDLREAKRKVKAVLNESKDLKIYPLLKNYVLLLQEDLKNLEAKLRRNVELR